MTLTGERERGGGREKKGVGKKGRGKGKRRLRERERMYARNYDTDWREGGPVAQSVERATSGEEVLGSIPAVAAHSLLVGSVSVKCDRLRQKSWSPSSVLCVEARKFVRRSVMGPVRNIT